ncbi:MAG: hypothetical protein KA804_01670 [Ottowia sp.]|nr:hypothetical protein [Ottowia sp.]
MRGFKPKRASGANNYANGGMVRGPGTGTSDDIETEIPVGSYIMPADTTRKVGAEALGELGKPVPVALSNGEYQMPPEQVHAVGVETLNQIKDATHTPVARGFNPGQAPQRDESRLFLNQGGSPVDEERKRRDALVNQIPTGGNPPAPPATAPAPAPALSTQAQGDRAAIGRAWNTVKGVSEDAGRAVADVATMVPRGLVGAYDSAVVRPMRAAGLNAGYLSPHLVPDGVDPASMTPFTDQKRMREAAAPAPNAGAGAGRGSVNPPAVVPSAPAAQTSLAGDAYMPGADANARPMFDTPAAPASNQVMPGVYQHGRGQYSDNPAGMGFAPGAGNPSANNIAAADALASRSAADVAGLVAAQDARGFQPQQSPQVRHSGNDWQARNDLRNLEVSASSITNQPRWSGQGGRQAAGSVPPAVAAYQAALQTDAELRRAVPSMDQMAMRENAATQRTGMQEQGSNARNTLDNTVRMADVGVRGFDAQARRANDARRASVDERRMTLDENTGNISIRAAQRLESLQTRYAEAKTDADRAKIAREIRDLSGKSDETADWAVQVTPQTKNPDGSTSEGSVIRYNKRTGEVQTVNGANRLTKDSPQVQQIVNDTSLTRDERKARLQALGFS